jgi:hypothetical protein
MKMLSKIVAWCILAISGILGGCVATMGPKEVASTKAACPSSVNDIVADPQGRTGDYAGAWPGTIKGIITLNKIQGTNVHGYYATSEGQSLVGRLPAGCMAFVGTLDGTTVKFSAGAATIVAVLKDSGTMNVDYRNSQGGVSSTFTKVK